MLQVTVSPARAVCDCGEKAKPFDVLTTEMVTFAALT